MDSNTAKLRLAIAVSMLLSLCACQPVTSPESPQVAESTPQVIIQDKRDDKEETQSIEIDNCDGKGDASRTEERSQSVDVTISAEVAAKLGASAGVISAEVQAAVGAAITHGAEKSSSIQLTAPPGTKMLFQLQWIGKEQIGIVQNLRRSTTPIAFRSFTPTDVRIKSQSDIGCPGSNAPKPVVTTIPTSTKAPPTGANTPSISPAKATCQRLKENFPQSLEEVKVKFNLPDSSNGTFSLVTEICPGVANGFVIRDTVTEFCLEVPADGCIDSWAGETRYEGDVGAPISDGYGGWRVYQGVVCTKGMTYRVTNCSSPQ